MTSKNEFSRKINSGDHNKMYKSTLDFDKMGSKTKIGAIGTICRDPYRLGSLSVPYHFSLVVYESLNDEFVKVNCPKNCADFSN